MTTNPHRRTVDPTGVFAPANANRPPAGVWRTLGEIFALAALIGLVAGLVHALSGL